MPAPRGLKKLATEGLWSYALRALAQRPHSFAELRQKLARRAESPEILQATLNKLTEYDLANDQKFSESYANSRRDNQGFGKGRVLRDLRAKRVSGRVAEQAVEQAFAGTHEPELIASFLARKYRGQDLFALFKDENKLAAAYRRLRTGGFSHSGSLAALKRFKNDLPEWEE